jgi:hypothetical protein
LTMTKPSRELIPNIVVLPPRPKYCRQIPPVCP